MTDRMFHQLDALAFECGVTRTRLVRQLLEAGCVTGPLRRPRPRQRGEELLAILTEKARAGNVAAIAPFALGAK
jgi:hypothetical protein